MQLNNPTQFYVADLAQQADCTPHSQISGRGHSSYHAREDTLPHPADDMIDYSGEKSDD